MEPTTDPLAMPGAKVEAQPEETAAEDFPVNLPHGLEEADVIKMASALNDTWSKFFETKAKEATEYAEIFNNKNKAQVKSSKSVAYPVAYGVVETIQARMAPNIFEKPKFIDMAPNFTAIDNQKTRLCNDFVNQQFAWRARSPQKGKAMLKGLIVEGTAFARSLWRQETNVKSQPIYEPHPITGAPVYTGEKDAVQDVGYWDFEYKSMLDVAYDPKIVTKIQDSTWARERSKMSLNQLYEWEQQGRIANVDKIADMMPQAISKNAARKEDWETKRREALGSKLSNFVYADEREYSIDEFFAKLSWKCEDEEGEEKRQFGFFHFMIVEEQQLVLFEENPLKPQRIPYISVPFVVNVGELLGMSAIKTIKTLCDQINTMAGRENDLIEKETNRPVYYDARSGLQARTTFQKLGGLVSVDNVDGIKEATPNPMGIKIVQDYINFLTQFVRDTSAATEQAQGLDGADTATEFQGLTANAFSRFAESISNFNVFAIAPLAEECFLHYQQFGKEGQMFVRESGPNGQAQPVTRMDLQGDYEFTPSTSQSENSRAAMIKQDDLMFQMMSTPVVQQAFAQQGKRLNLEKFFVERIMANRQMKNGDDYVEDLAPQGMPLAPQGLPGQGIVPRGTPPMPQPNLGQPQPEPV